MIVAQSFLYFRHYIQCEIVIFFIKNKKIVKIFFLKVISIVHNQLERAFATNPESLEQLDKIFQQKFSYFYMQKIWERERIEQEELELNSKTIQSLRDFLRPNIEQLVIKRKKNFLKKGLIFAKFLAAGGKNQNNHKDHSLSQLQQQHLSQQQLWFWHLDENERHLCFMDCKLTNGKQNELDYSTLKKISIINIRRIIYGPEYSNKISQQFGVKFSKKSQSSLRCGLCIELNDESEQFHLTTINEADLNAWIDGMNCLIMLSNTVLQSTHLKKEVIYKQDYQIK